MLLQGLADFVDGSSRRLIGKHRPTSASRLSGFFGPLLIVVSHLFGLTVFAQQDSRATFPNEATNSPVTLADEAGVVSFREGTETFRSLGVCVVIPEEGAPRDPERCYNGLKKHGGDIRRWAEATGRRLQEWGFNTLGAWCDPSTRELPLYHAEVLWIGGTGTIRLMDVFEPDFEKKIEEQTRQGVEPFKNRPRVLGYFINNELPFYGDYGWPSDSQRTLLDRYLEKPPEDPGKAAAADFLLGIYRDGDRAREDWDFTGPWERENLLKIRRILPRNLEARRHQYRWAGHVAERFFRAAHAAVRKHDPGRLILGSRFAGKPPRAVAEAIAPYTDVVSINLYTPSGVPDLKFLRNLYALTRRPILIGEFSWRAQENRSGLANSKGAEVTVPTQKDRAERLLMFSRELAKEPYLVGMHWFQYADQPPAGRSLDGENSNYGLVDIEDKPYEEVTGAMQRVLADWQKPRRAAGEYRFDEAEWAELLPARLSQGSLTQPATVSAKELLPVGIKADTGNQGAWGIEKGTLLLDASSREGWGLHGDFRPSRPADFSGAKNVSLKAEIPEGVSFRFLIEEIGSDAPGRQSYDGVRGSDGESWELPMVQGRGGIATYNFPLEDATPRLHWGNQRGNRTLDLQSLDRFSLYLPPGADPARISIESVTFSP